MDITRKTIRFYDSEKDKVALEALNNYADYGFSSANDMVVGALYELARHQSSGISGITPNELADMIAERLNGKLHITQTTDTPANTTTSSSVESLDIIQDDDGLDNALDFLNSFQKGGLRFGYKHQKSCIGHRFTDSIYGVSGIGHGI